MALLTVEKRKEYFAYLGLGEYNKTNILKLQKAYMLRQKDYDGIYGTNTDNLLRTVYNVKKYTKNFKPEEFKCGCNGKYCCGYPTELKKELLENLQEVRSHYGKAVKITSGLRCSTYNNKLSGSASNSRHLSGKAADFHQAGLTDSLSGRKTIIKHLKSLKNHRYSYGNGYSSSGVSVKAPNMGNAVHTDVN